MNETTILLAGGDPSAKPDFLATVEPILPKQLPFTLPFELIFDGYTRESWSSGSSKVTSISDTQSSDDELLALLGEQMSYERIKKKLSDKLGRIILK